MGNEVVCPVEYDGERADAKVLLETEELIIRSPFRLKIPFGEIKKLDADESQLNLKWGSHSLAIEVGRDAKKWAEKIRNPKPLVEKLGIKSGQKISIAGTLDEKFIDELRDLGSDVSKRLRDGSDVIFFAVDATRDLAPLSDMKNSLVPDGAVWIIRPKGSAAIPEREVMAAGKAAGLVDVKVARFSASHTAEKYVIRVKDRDAHRNRG